jgi:methylase of polypeptide subunit release factors
LRSFYRAIEKVTVLDPTCGSGAFLFAALNILEPMYESCLERMEAFIIELDNSNEKHRSDKYSDFRKILKQVYKHPNLKYFIYKSIILNNLYGVDIMEEAVEICKLRLFLKLMAQVDRVEHIEALPDIDFNIKAGNTLVGFASFEDVKKALEVDMIKKLLLPKLEENSEIADRAYQKFREMQIEHDMDAKEFSRSKIEIRERLGNLNNELDSYLAEVYEIDPDDKNKFNNWKKSHQPFHWYSEFYGIIKNGGFDVIIGNPPYVEYSTVRKQYIINNYDVESCGNLYAFVIERNFEILCLNGRSGMIVQLPMVCTDRMKPLQNICKEKDSKLWFANFDDRPARLFEGLQHIRATIYLAKKGKENENIYSTKYNRWYSEVRSILFNLLAFEEISDSLFDGAIPKIGDIRAKNILHHISSYIPLGRSFSADKSFQAYFHNAPQYWIRAMDFAPYFWNERDGEQISTHVKQIYFSNNEGSLVSIAVLNSSLFYWWFILLSNCRDLTLREIINIPVSLDQISQRIKKELSNLTKILMEDFKKNSSRRESFYQTTGKVIYDEYFPKYSKPIIDEIDKVLAKHYGFTEEELDFIINYDIKYRMGVDTSSEDGGD